jgi:hypothetical protein
MQNMFSGNELSSGAVETLRNGQRSPVELSPYDPPYFFVRSFEELSGNRIGGPGFEGDPYKVVEADDWIKIDLEEKADDTLSDEVLFLEDFGLATMGDTEHICHVNPMAIEVFYGPGRFFEEPTDKSNILHFLGFMRDYVLPGQYWRSYYAAADLPAAARTIAQREMFDVEAEWRSLVGQIGAEEVEDDVEHSAEGQV